MSVQRTSVSRTTSLTGAAVFGALAAVITFLIQIPWLVPGFTFLQLDLAEIVDVLAFLLFGPAVGLFTTLIHYLVLNFLPTPSPIFGPLLKLFGVTSMLLGMWLGYGAYARILKRRGGVITGFGIMSGTGAALRAIILTPINYVFLIFVFFPNTVFSTSYLSFYFVGLATIKVTGIPVSCSILETNSLASLSRSSIRLAPLVPGNSTSSLVNAIWVAPLSWTALFASLKSKGAALLSRPVTVPNSVHPRRATSSRSSCPCNGPSPTRVTYALKMTMTSST